MVCHLILEFTRSIDFGGSLEPTNALAGKDQFPPVLQGVSSSLGKVSIGENCEEWCGLRAGLEGGCVSLMELS